MKFRRIAVYALAAALAVYAGVQVVLACRGTPRPSCQQTVWLAKYAPGVIPYPGAGVPIVVPIGLVPYLTWTDAVQCADPVALDLTLTLTCAPVGGGAATVIGPLTVPLNPPLPPQGIQGVLLPGGGPAPLNIYAFIIPAGTLPPGAYVCAVAGEFSVTFAGGTGPGPTGAGTITAVGDTEVCIVEPAPGGDPDLPRLDLELLRPDGFENYQICRRGDQSCNYYLLTNNDLNTTVAVTLDTRTTQIAGLPTTDSPTTTGIYAISGPVGTDAFPQQFAERQSSPLIAETDPSALTDNAISKTIVLPPHGVEVIAVNIRSFGACADGSCSDVLMKAFGTYEDGTEVVACAGTSFIVGDAPGKSPLCEYFVQLKTGQDFVTAVTPIVFDGDPHHAVFKDGNLPPYGGDFNRNPRRPKPNDLLRMQVIGNNRQGPFSFNQPPSQQDYVRLDHEADRATYTVAQFDGDGNQTTNLVNVTGLDGFRGQVELPFFLEPDRPATTLRVFIDVEADSLRVQRKQGRRFRTIHTGDFGGGFGGPPLGSRLITQPGGGCIVIGCEGFPSGADVVIDPAGDAELLELGVDYNLRYTPRDRFTGDQFDSFESNTTVGTLSAFTVGGPIFYDLDVPTGDIAEVPGTTIGWLDVSPTVPALRDPVYMPFALRKGPIPPAPNLLDVTRLKIRGSFGTTKRLMRRNRVTLLSRIGVGDGFDPTDKVVVAKVGNWIFPFRLNKRGRGTALTVDGARAVLKVAARKRRGNVFAQDARVTFSTRGGGLYPALLETGVENETVPKPGETLAVPVSIFFCGEFYDAELNTLLRAIENRNFSLNGPQQTQ